MSANVETMMYVREKPWHDLGVCVQEAPTSAEALRLAGLDWTVDQEPVQVAGGAIIPGFKANVRSSDKRVLGIVSDRYTVVQNHEAFSFTDSLVGGDVRYETAGSLKNGRKIWLLARMPETKINGDAVEPYMCFSNTHDGSGAVRVCMTPIRVVCNNTLNLAMKQAKRAWSVRHTGNIDTKLHEARMCLELGEEYMDHLSVYADRLANITVTNDKLQAIMDEMFPIDRATATKRELTAANKIRDDYMVCLFAPDLLKFQGSAWAAINAMSDMATHTRPLRQTKNYWQNNWDRVMGGHDLIDRMAEALVRK